MATEMTEKEKKYDELLDAEIAARAVLVAAKIASVDLLDAGKRDEAFALIAAARAELSAIRAEMIALKQS